MEASVVIPTRGRAGQLAKCLRHLADQTIAKREYEVLIGLDGPDEESARAAERIASETSMHLHVLACPRLGVGGVKNRLLGLARGRTLVFTNDDVYAERGFLEAHVRAQEEVRGRGGAMVLGDSPWVVAQPDRLFDRLVRETSMVFFYDQMRGAGASDRAKDWGFRHAWNLNLSAPTDAVMSVAGFYNDPTNLYGYEDLELAWRLQDRMGMAVLFRPEAVGRHEHRYEPSGYLARERRLGHAALGFARVSPRCAREVFGRDITSEEEIAYSREFVERERKTAARLAEGFESLAAIPAGAVGGAYADAIIRLVYQQHLLLKRWCWRSGLVAAAEGMGVEAVEKQTLFTAALTQ